MLCKAAPYGRPAGSLAFLCCVMHYLAPLGQTLVSIYALQVNHNALCWFLLVFIS